MANSFSILIVDDDERHRLLVRRFLQGLPFKAFEASDGEEAVEIFVREDIDLVIMDIIMPLMDGVDAIAAIRKTEAGRSVTPVLALSAEGSVETGLDCLGAGANRLLIKPVSRQGLLETVCGMLEIEVPVASLQRPV